MVATTPIPATTATTTSAYDVWPPTDNDPNRLATLARAQAVLDAAPQFSEAVPSSAVVGPFYADFSGPNQGTYVRVSQSWSVPGLSQPILTFWRTHLPAGGQINGDGSVKRGGQTQHLLTVRLSATVAADAELQYAAVESNGATNVTAVVNATFDPVRPASSLIGTPTGAAVVQIDRSGEPGSGKTMRFIGSDETELIDAMNAAPVSVGAICADSSQAVGQALVTVSIPTAAGTFALPADPGCSVWQLTTPRYQITLSDTSGIVAALHQLLPEGTTR